MTTAQHVQACPCLGQALSMLPNKNNTTDKMKPIQYVKTGYCIYKEKRNPDEILDFASVFTSLQAVLKTFKKEIKEGQFRLYKVEFVPSDEDLSQELILAKSVHVLEEVKLSN
jgi:hypothetical protein